MMLGSIKKHRLVLHRFVQLKNVCIGLHSFKYIYIHPTTARYKSSSDIIRGCVQSSLLVHLDIPSDKFI